MMTFLLESLVACALFTLFVFLMSRNPIMGIPAALVAGGTVVALSMI